MRAFRIVCVLNIQDFNRCFSVHGALKRPHKGVVYRSLRAAREMAENYASAGWTAGVVRRTRTGWEEVEVIDGPERFTDPGIAARAARAAYHGMPDIHKQGLRPAVFEVTEGLYEIGTWPANREAFMPEGAWIVAR